MRKMLLAAVAAVLLAPGPADAATSYCLRGTMADGSWTRTGSLAHNGFALGARVWATPAVFGRHRWTVRDRIGWGSEADFWSSSCIRARTFGRRGVTLTRGWRGWALRHARRQRARARV